MVTIHRVFLRLVAIVPTDVAAHTHITLADVEGVLPEISARESIAAPFTEVKDAQYVDVLR